jgi:hypothetical protein
MDLYIHSPVHLHGVVLHWLSTGTTLLLPLPPGKFRDSTLIRQLQLPSNSLPIIIQLPSIQSKLCGLTTQNIAEDSANKYIILILVNGLHCLPSRTPGVITLSR